MSKRSRLMLAALVIAIAGSLMALGAPPASRAVIPGDGGGSCAAIIYAPVVSFGYIQARGDVPCNSPYNWRICLEYWDFMTGWQTVLPLGCRSSGVPFGAGYPARYASSYFVSKPCPYSLWFRTFFEWQYQYDSLRWGWSGARYLSC
jgi:hypothetical protein